MRDELALEKIGRFAHRALMMAIETKNVWQKTHTQLCFGNSQPQVVVLPPKPTEFVQFVIITADFDELLSIEHCHCIDIGKLDRFWDFSAPRIARCTHAGYRRRWRYAGLFRPLGKLAPTERSS